MKNKIEQTENAIINTIINGIWRSVLTQTIDKERHMHIIHEVFKGKKLIKREERIF